MSKEFASVDPAVTTDDVANPARDARKRIFKAGIASYQNHALTANCVVRDVTADGARLRFEEGAFVPEKFALSIPVDGTRVDCEVKWRRDLDMGVLFTSEIEQDARTGRKQAVDVKYVVPRKSSLRKQPE
ncbi:MAG: hypothetical protein ABJM29_15565 [Rhizobiaceae bacterium]